MAVGKDMGEKWNNGRRIRTTEEKPLEVVQWCRTQHGDQRQWFRGVIAKVLWCFETVGSTHQGMGFSEGSGYDEDVSSTCSGFESYSMRESKLEVK